MEAIALESVGSKVFKAQKLSHGLKQLERDNLLKKTNKFILAAKSCNGTYHSVNSDISKLIKKKKQLINKGIINEFINALSPDEAVHGQRFIIFNKNKNKAYLLGDVITAMKKLAG
ncbi:hypothetical protein GF374_03055 [Candidatus Woesearchaeota archaeon]|nr:hypothetical protein [Candidatus Woesearchaeota archaeon]